MDANRMTKFYSRDDRHITVGAATGHFATSQSHVNYYIDVTRLKINIKEASEAAKSIYEKLRNRTPEIDTIVCMDDSLVLGALLGVEMDKGEFGDQRKDSVHVISPELNSFQQMVFRPNLQYAVEGKNVLVLSANISTGNTINQATRVVNYYGGQIVAAAAIFSTIQESDGVEVYSLFTKEDFPDYQTYYPHECPLCKKGMAIEAMVSGSGYSLLR